MKEYRPRLNQDDYDRYLYYQKDASRVLVVGDLHAPFLKWGYLDFCLRIHKLYNCNEVVFIGDLLDNHYSSFHETDPDGMSAIQEFETAIKEINLWYQFFPKAKVCIGNHDLIPDRKRFTAGISDKWLKKIDEVLGTEKWEFSEEHKIENVLYNHGTGRKARHRARDELLSIVQGHYHSESYVEYFVGLERRIFAMQVGCGIDRRAYAMAYGRHFKKPHINCGVVIEGRTAILEYMELGKDKSG